MFDEDFGKLKMEKFKEYCRNILGSKVKAQTHAPEYAALTKEYESALDIVSAYKSLKQAVLKPATVHGADVTQGNKGYLKMTIAAT